MIINDAIFYHEATLLIPTNYITHIPCFFPLYSVYVTFDILLLSWKSCYRNILSICISP